MIRHKIVRLIEQPSIIRETILRIQPSHANGVLNARKIFGKDFNMLIDVGSCMGEFSKAFSLYFPRAKIYKFDINDETGLWNKNTKIKFNKGYNPQWSSILANNFPNRVETTYVRRFDNLKIKIVRPCLLKIDVEGAEWQVLRGFGKRLKEIDVIQIENVFKNGFSKIMLLLEKEGFKVFKQINVTYHNNEPSKCDIIFARCKNDK